MIRPKLLRLIRLRTKLSQTFYEARVTPNPLQERKVTGLLSCDYGSILRFEKLVVHYSR